MATGPWVALGLGAATTLALAGFWLHEPAGEVTAPPLKVPVLTQAPRAHGADSPEAEPAGEDAPLMPVGTKDLPEQLDRHQLENAMQRAKPHFERCLKHEPFVGLLTVRFVIARSGNVQTAQLQPPPPEHTPFYDCITKTARNTSFPRFRGTLLPTIELTYPLLFKPEGGLF